MQSSSYWCELVRKSRTVETRDGIRIRAGSNRPSSLGPITEADGGDPQDMLAIFNASLGTDTAPLWRDRMPNGLSAPDVKLVHELRTKVGDAAKTP